MSFESEPVRGSRPVVRRRRRRGALIPTLILLGVLIVLVLVVDGIWTDALWYGQLGFTSVYRTQLLMQILLFVLGFLVMAGAVLSSLIIAYRTRPVYVPTASEQSGIERYREALEPLRRLVVLAVPAVLGIFAGSAVTGQWQTVLLWWNGVSFNRDDPQFGLDVGFFVFTLPFVEFLVGFLTAVVVLSGIAAIVAHYLYGGLRLAGPGPRLTSAARIHLSVIAAAFLFLRAIDYWLGRYDLAVNFSGRFTGLNYTDAHATLTARGILAGIALIVAALFIVGALVEGWWRSLPVYGVVGLLVCAILIGGIYPAIVQRFQVTPSAQTLEAPYIQRNIDATRAAYGLDTVKADSYSGQTQGAQAAAKAATTAQPGIRLIDPTVVTDAFRQQQQISQYYTFPESLDVDRYTVEGAQRDSVVAVRELNQGGLGADQRNWINDHIVYTHGIGLVAAYGDRPGSNGNPDFYEENIPPTDTIGKYEPRVYFGEESPDYSIVGAPPGSPQRELDYPTSSTTRQQNTTYGGSGGVSIGSPVNRLLYAVKFREQNILLSDAVTSQSRIMYDRSPRDRVQKVAPYLTLDGDPYPSVVDGRVVWILDGYTTTSQFPYSQTTSLRDVTSDSVTQRNSNVVALDAQDINYIRNSVKATVDAYTGAVTLYAWDEADPVLKTWMKIFPGTVKSLKAMSGQLMSHVRYPEDLFKVQRTMLGRYHVTDANAFFGGQDFWQVPADPTDNDASPGLQPPFYFSVQMPGQPSPTYSLTSTFIPQSNGTQTRNVLTGYLAVDSDAGSKAGVRGEDYGQLRLLQLPKDTSVPAPGQVQANFTADAVVSNQLNILGGGRTGSGSLLEYGNLLTLPLAGGLLYVEPVYLRSSVGSTSVPLLQRVLVSYNNSIGYAQTLSCALDQAFNNRQPGTGNSQACAGDQAATGANNGTGNQGTETTPPSSSGPTSPGTSSGGTQSAQQQLQQALAAAQAAYNEGQAALKRGDFAAYGKAQQKLASALQQARDAEQRLVSTPAASATPKPSATG
ncbi:MAG TPA: UPF0182 family protein [Kineosporiaceae bacterium]|nr:UPF0182 family protein [Kineosporiaceae bacterium]